MDFGIITQIVSTNGLAVFLVVYAVFKGPKIIQTLVDELKAINTKLTEIKTILEIERGE